MFTQRFFGSLKMAGLGKGRFAGSEIGKFIIFTMFVAQLLLCVFFGVLLCLFYNTELIDFQCFVILVCEKWPKLYVSWRRHRVLVSKFFRF